MQNVKWVEAFVDRCEPATGFVEIVLTEADDGDDGEPTDKNGGDIKNGFDGIDVARECEELAEMKVARVKWNERENKCDEKILAVVADGLPQRRYGVADAAHKKK